jgi:hypothetical protein
MNRRIFGLAIGGITAIALMKKQAILTHTVSPSVGWESTSSSVTGPSWPTEVAGVRVKTNVIISLAIQELRNTSSAVLVNHAARTFYFGALIGHANKNNFDTELLFLACLLHDLGLTEAHMGPLPFEIQGAEAARRLLLTAGLNARSAEVVWDAIAMHPLTISGFKRPEIALVAAGASADVLGVGLDKVDSSQMAEVLDAFPRLAFKREFVRSCADVVQRYPRGATRTFMRDIGDRQVPSFHAKNICDSIEQAPFAE